MDKIWIKGHGRTYSYFQRRPPFPIKFTYPLVNDMKTALGGPSRKLALHRREWMMHYYPSAKDMDPSFTPIRVIAVVQLQSMHVGYKWFIIHEKCGRPDSNGFQLKWRIGTHGHWKNQNPGGRFGVTLEALFC